MNKTRLSQARSPLSRPAGRRLERLVSLVKVQHVKKGEIVSPRVPGRHVLFGGEGRRQNFSTSRQGKPRRSLSGEKDFFGEMALLVKDERSAGPRRSRPWCSCP